MKVLVVDGSTTMRRIVLNALKSIGLNDVAEAGDGTEALQKIAGIDLVVTEWDTPGMGGIELVKRLRAAEATARTPVLMVTTRSAQEDILEAVEAGVSGYILKPVSPQVLKEKIAQVTAAPGS
jgi:two-component system chemotaxis response regulator CheY